jgi:hypothetical protein
MTTEPAPPTPFPEWAASVETFARIIDEDGAYEAWRQRVPAVAYAAEIGREG